SRMVLVATDPTITTLKIKKLSGSAYANTGFDDSAEQTSTDGVLEALNTTISTGILGGDITFRITTVTAAGTSMTDVTLRQSDTDANEGIGNDLPKLLDRNNAPTFATAQDLKDRLFTMIGLPGSVSYDSTDKILSYTLDLTRELASIDIPINFGFNLGPIGSVNTTGSPMIRLDGSVDFHVTLGVKLGTAGGSPIAPSDDLTTLKGVDVLDDIIKPEFALQPAAPPSAVFVPTTVSTKLTFGDSGAVLAGNPQLVFASGPKTITRAAGSWDT